MKILELKPLADLTKMKQLSLSRVTGKADGAATLKGLEKMTHLESLTVSSPTLSDITAIAGLSKLRFLDLGTIVYNQNTMLTDISPLSGLVNLTGLFLVHCTNIGDLRPLASLTELTVLRLGCEASGMPDSGFYDNKKIQDLSPLQGMTKLTDLSLNNCSAVSDVKPLTALNQLKLLDLGGCTSVNAQDRQMLTDALPTTNIIS